MSLDRNCRGRIVHTFPTQIPAFLLEVSEGTKLICSSSRQAQNWPRWCCLDTMALESCDKIESENLSMDREHLSVSQSLLWTCLARIREVRDGFDPHRDMRQLLWGNILCLTGLWVLKVFCPECLRMVTSVWVFLFTPNDFWLLCLQHLPMAYCWILICWTNN